MISAYPTLLLTSIYSNRGSMVDINRISLDVSKMGADAARFVESSFDSNVLNVKILERKRVLLKE